MAKLKTSASEIPDFFGTTKTPDLAVARLARIPGADPAIYQQFVDAMGLRDTLQQGTKEYADGIRASQPEADRVAGQDIAELDNLDSPTGYQAALQGTRDRRTKALADLNNILFGDMRRGLGIGRVGGGGSAGLSSTLARIAASEAGKIRATAAADTANQERTDLAALISARQGALGKRTAVLDQNLQRALLPGEAEAKAGATFSDALSKALLNILQNSFSGVGANIA